MDPKASGPLTIAIDRRYAGPAGAAVALVSGLAALVLFVRLLRRHAVGPVRHERITPDTLVRRRTA